MRCDAAAGELVSFRFRWWISLTLADGAHSYREDAVDPIASSTGDRTERTLSIGSRVGRRRQYSGQVQLWPDHVSAGTRVLHG